MEGPREEEPSPDLDRIRKQLRDLGYLRGPLSRLEGWMLAGRGGPSSFLRMNAAASLRVAAVGGPLLGAGATAAVALANRPHIIAPRDLLLLAVYFSLVLGSMLGLLEFLTDLVLARAARRGFVLVGRIERIAARSGLVFTAATTLYLAWLLRGGRRAAGEGSGAWLAGTAAVLLALAVGHFIGRITRAGSLLALAAGAGEVAPAGAATGSGARRRPVLLGGAVVLAAAALLVFLPAGLFGPDPRAASRFEPRPFPGRIVVIGIDGLSASLFDTFLEAGTLPHLGRLQAEGARYALSPQDQRVPPATWTTIATGRPREEHGIVGYRADRVAGLSSPVQEPPDSPIVPSIRMLLGPVSSPPSPVSSGLRRARAVWEILASRGVETAVVNWWATWPASPGEGIVVSERAFPRMSAGLTPARDISPDSLERALAERFSSDLAAAREASEEPAGGAFPGREVADTSMALDGYHALVALRLFDGGLARVLLLYLPGLDIARVRVQKEEAAIREAVTEQVLRRADALVGAAAIRLEPRDLLLVVADPGRLPGEGFLLACGARVIPGRMARRGSLLDLAPTLLTLSGFPTARDLTGVPILDFLRGGDSAALAPVPIDTFGPRIVSETGGVEDPFDKEVLDRLRSLGYIQ